MSHAKNRLKIWPRIVHERRSTYTQAILHPGTSQRTSRTTAMAIIKHMIIKRINGLATFLMTIAIFGWVLTPSSFSKQFLAQFDLIKTILELMFVIGLNVLRGKDLGRQSWVYISFLGPLEICQTLHCAMCHIILQLTSSWSSDCLVGILRSLATLNNRSHSSRYHQNSLPLEWVSQGWLPFQEPSIILDSWKPTTRGVLEIHTRPNGAGEVLSTSPHPNPVFGVRIQATPKTECKLEIAWAGSGFRLVRWKSPHSQLGVYIHRRWGLNEALSIAGQMVGNIDVFSMLLKAFPSMTSPMIAFQHSTLISLCSNLYDDVRIAFLHKLLQ